MNDKKKVVKSEFGLILVGLLVLSAGFGFILNPETAQAQKAEYLVSQLEINERISVDIEEMKLTNALELITGEANLGLSYNSSLIPDKNASLSVNNMPVLQALNLLLENTGLRAAFITNGNAVTIYESDRNGENRQFLNFNDEIQERVAGSVSDAATGNTMPGVNIVIKGTDSGTASDMDGNFSLNVPSLQDTLVFSYIGYQRQEVPIDGRTEINVELQMEIFGSEELVVVGYGTRTRETLTGSVRSISGERLEKAPVTNISNSLSGQIPGVVTINPSGEPGADGASIRIRGEHTLGDNSPLIVIDGVPNRSGGMERLNPRDIENISVLKDASAAIYGAQAANGVILITTKRGQAGATQFSIDFNQGMNQPTRVPQMADAATYLEMLNEIAEYRGNSAPYSQERIENHRQGTDPWLYPDTDWFAETLKPVSLQTRGDMSVSGGSETVKYYLSFGGLTEDGYYNNSATRYNQYNIRSNIDGQITDNVTLGFDVTGRFEDRNYPTRSAGNIFRMVMRGKPHLPAYWPNGLPGPDIEYGDNPVVVGTPETGYNNDERYYFQSNLSLNVEIPAVQGLSFRSNIAYDKNFREQSVWQTPWTLYTWDYETYDGNGEPMLEGSSRGYAEPRLFQERGSGEDVMVNLIANYQQDISDHSFGILAGVERQTFSNSFMNAFRRHFSSVQIDQLFAGGEDELSNTGSASKGARQNYFTRLNYDYQDKYLFEFVGRYDGSYIFPEERRFGFFPAVSVGWRLTQEDWFVNITDFFNELKLRSSWGQTGNDRIDEFQYFATFGFGNGYVFDNNVIVNSIYPTRTPNLNVTWEVANQFDVGLEAEFLDNRFIFEIDYFNYLREDILWWRNASVPMTSGFSLPRENIGEVSSHGFDGSVTYREQISGNFLFDVTLNASYATNEIKFWDEAPGAPEWQRSTGYPMNTNMYYNAIGIFQDSDEIENTPSWEGARPGDIIFEDVNGDGAIDGRDRIRLDKNNIPKWTGGVNINVAYSNFDLSLLFQGAAGAVHYVDTESGEIGNFLTEFAENRWTEQNPSTTHPRTWNRDDEYWASNANTYFLKDTDYIRLKNLEFGYNLPADLSTRFGIQQMRVYASGFNLLTWSKLKVMDPETASGSGQYYPQKRVLNLGFSLKF
ncbi:MAG: SusC/RagA family TonB-linked outer membrane protein [Balneolaceae bacterium]